MRELVQLEFKHLKDGMAFSDVHVLIESMSKGMTKKKSEYLTLKLRDSEGKNLDAKKWSSEDWPEEYKTGSVCKIAGNVGSYQGKLQLTINSVAQSSKEPTDFSKNSDRDLDIIWSDLVNIVGSFTEELPKYIGEALLTDDALVKRFKKAPAAVKVHNNWIGGLMEHAHAMCMMAEGVITQYKNYVPSLSRDKILLGCLIHDMGKIWEYDYESSPTIKWTPYGTLLGHITIGQIWIAGKLEKYTKEKVSAEFRDDAVLVEAIKRAGHEIIHITASHHGKLEYGSPVVPATLEAVIVHQLDMMETQAMHAIEMMKNEGDMKGFSERSWTFGTQYMLPK